MKPEEFIKLRLEKRYELLRNHGNFIGSRFSNGYNVHLFGIFGFYVEMWQRISLHEVVWIEVVKELNILQLYTENLDVKGDLELE